MNNSDGRERAAFFLIGAAIGAAAALLLAPASGVRTRRRLARKGEEIADYLMDAGKELVDKCEDLYEHSGELARDLAQDAARELTRKYHALHEHSKQLLEETETVLRRARDGAKGR